MKPAEIIWFNIMARFDTLYKVHIFRIAHVVNQLHLAFSCAMIYKMIKI